MNARLFRYCSAGATLDLSMGSAAAVRAAPAEPRDWTAQIICVTAQLGLIAGFVFSRRRASK